MFINNFDPVAIEIFSLEIRWYSLSYIAGILIGWLLAKYLFINDKNIKNQIDDYISYLIVGLILGLIICFGFFFISKKKQNPMEETNFNDLDVKLKTFLNEWSEF